MPLLATFDLENACARALPRLPYGHVAPHLPHGCQPGTPTARSAVFEVSCEELWEPVRRRHENPFSSPSESAPSRNRRVRNGFDTWACYDYPRLTQMKLGSPGTHPCARTRDTASARRQTSSALRLLLLPTLRALALGSGCCAPWLLHASSLCALCATLRESRRAAHAPQSYDLNNVSKCLVSKTRGRSARSARSA